MQTRMFYVDDSGASETGYAIYSWIECDITAWRQVLRTWLDLRNSLFAEYRILPRTELHASLFVNGRGRPSLDPVWNLHKANRLEAAELALDAIGRCADLRVGTAYRRFGRPRDFGTARAGLYARLIEFLDQRLAAAGELGLVSVDGDGSDPAYLAAHRDLSLAHRHVIEDPLFCLSDRSQWIQMADFVAYAAYQSLLKSPNRRQLWHWYDRYLGCIDAYGGPMEL